MQSNFEKKRISSWMAASAITRKRACPTSVYQQVSATEYLVGYFKEQIVNRYNQLLLAVQSSTWSRAYHDYHKASS